MSNDVEIMKEMVAEDMKLMQEIIMEDMVPLLQFREKLEKKEFEKAFREMKKLEGEV